MKDQPENGRAAGPRSAGTAVVRERGAGAVERVEPVDPGVPLRMGPHTILGKLTAGGMATIYVARRDGEDRPCVIKVLHSHLANDNTVAQRFLREAQVSLLLDHENVGRLTDAKRTDDGSFYIAMEFISGRDFETVIHHAMKQKRALPPALVMAVAEQTLAGLEYAHSLRDADGQPMNLVHRDLSPRNVMVTYDGVAKVIDFGLARADRVGQFQTMPGMVMGTLRYVSPEQAMAGLVDRRADLYSMAVIIYEALSGQPVVSFEGARTDFMREVVAKETPPLSERMPGLPAGLDAVLAKAMHKDPRRRYDSAKEFSDALRMAAAEIEPASRELVGEYIRFNFGEAVARDEDLVEMARSSLVSALDHVNPGSSEATKVGVAMAAADLPPAWSTPTRIEQLPVPSQHVPVVAHAAPKTPRNLRQAMLIAGMSAVAVVLVALVLNITRAPETIEVQSALPNPTRVAPPLPAVIPKAAPTPPVPPPAPKEPVRPAPPPGARAEVEPPAAAPPPAVDEWAGRRARLEKALLGLVAEQRVEAAEAETDRALAWLQGEGRITEEQRKSARLCVKAAAELGSVAAARPCLPRVAAKVEGGS